MARFLFKAIHEVEAEDLEQAIKKFKREEVKPEWEFDKVIQ